MPFQPVPLGDDVRPVDVCGYQIWPVTPQSIVEHVLWQMQAGKGSWILPLNLDLVARGRRDPEFSELIRQADVTIADGSPLVWAAKKKRPELREMDRVTGSDLTRNLIRAVEPDTTGIIGGKNPRLALEKQGLDPRAGWYIFDGMVTIDEPTLEKFVRELEGRRLVFVALGVPKQEKLIQALRPRMPETTFIAVGGSFEFLAGLTNRAPEWMQRRGMEWMYRLGSEPKRLWRRYLVEYWPGATLLVRDVRASRKRSSG